MNQLDKDTTTQTWFGLLRAQENLGAKARIGCMFNYRHDQLDGNTNTVFSADGFWQVTEPLFIRPMLSYSMNTNGKNRGAAFFNELAFVKNKYALRWFQTVVTKDYLPKTGFVSRNNFINTRPSLTLNLPVKWLGNRLRFLGPSMLADIFHEASTKNLQEINLNITPLQGTLASGASFWAAVLPTWQRLSAPFNPVPGVIIPEGDYHYTYYNVGFSSNQSAPLSFNIEASAGGYYNAYLSRYTIGGRYRPIPQISFVLTYFVNRFTQLKTNQTAVVTHLVAPEARISFTPKIQLTGFYQYNTVTNLGGLNARFAWEYQPLSFVYLVFNNVRTLDEKPGISRINDAAAILKVSYIKQL